MRQVVPLLVSMCHHFKVQMSNIDMFTDRETSEVQRSHYVHITLYSTSQQQLPLFLSDGHQSHIP